MDGGRDDRRERFVASIGDGDRVGKEPSVGSFAELERRLGDLIWRRRKRGEGLQLVFEAFHIV